MQDSNLRRQCHQIYSLTPLTARETPLWLVCIACGVIRCGVICRGVIRRMLDAQCRFVCRAATESPSPESHSRLHVPLPKESCRKNKSLPEEGHRPRGQTELAAGVEPATC